MSQKKAWLIVLVTASLTYLIIYLVKSALGLDFLFHDKLAVGDQRRMWVWALVFFPFAIILGLFLFNNVMSRAAKVWALLGTLATYSALSGEIIMSMSGAWLLIFPVVLLWSPLEQWLELDRAGFLPFRGTLAQDVVVPALIALSFAITIVGLVQVVIAARKKLLVTDGLYATMRHPQHLGIVLWTLAFALWGAYALDFVVWFTLAFALTLLAWYEGENMARQFGAAYQTYQGNTPFMVPFLPKRGPLFHVFRGKELAILSGILLLGIAIILAIFHFCSVPWSPTNI